MSDRKVVIVHIEGGCVTEVEQPLDIDVHILDLDTEGADDENLCRCEISSVVTGPHFHGEYLGEPATETPAHARLVAAVNVQEDLLAALENIVESYPKGDWLAAIDEARAAIAKALGSPEAS